MHNTTSAPSFLGHAPPSRSTVQHSQGLTCQGDCHLEHRHFTAPPGCGSATVDVRELRHLESSISEDYPISVSGVPQLSSCPITPTPLLARSSALAGHLSRELNSAQVPLSLGHIAGQSNASIDSPLVDHTLGYRDIQGHASGYIMNPTYAVEQWSGYPQESWDVSTFGDLDNSLAGPTMCLGPVPSLHNCTSCQVISSDAPRSWLSNPLFPSLQELHPLDDFTVGSIPTPPEKTQTEIEQICPRTLFPYRYPIPSPSDSMSHSTSHCHISSYPSFLTPNQNTSSGFPQEHLRCSFPAHPHPTRPAGLPDFPGLDAGSNIELHPSGTLDKHAAQVLGDHPSCTLSGHEIHPFRNHVTYISDDHTTSNGVDDYGNVDENKSHSGQVVGLRSQLPLPPNRLPLSSRTPHSHDRVSRIEDGSLSRTFRHTCRSATTRPRFPTRLSKVRSVCCHSVPRPCGWRDGEGKECGMPVNCSNRAEYFTAAHPIRKTARYDKVVCFWCPSKSPMAITRNNF
ncbi:hypothetical protein F5141DRAFT_624838 [Pisolithus sp. B1]|nr:hypothetical protein F5141DRAFT_624838 [Pisolithus sp. B1]